MVPVDGAGRVDQDGIEAAGLPVLGGGHDGGAESRAAAEIFASRADPGLGAVDRGDARRRRKLAVLPPGAAQRSATVRPERSPNSRAGSAAAASCTHQAPSP